MHLKRIVKRTAALGLAVSVLMSNMTMVSGADLSSVKLEDQVEISVTETEEDAPVLPETGDEAKEEEVKEDETDSGETDPEIGTEEEKFKLTKTEFSDETETSYELEISNCELEEGDSLEAAVWSDANGQDDLKWMKLEKKAEGIYTLTIKISDFKSPGEYIVHIYNKKEDGSQKYVGGKRFQVTEMSSGTVEIREQAYEEGIAGIQISDIHVPSGVSKVRAEVWSQKDQSDIHRYAAEKTEDGWYVDMDIAKYHKNNWSVYTVQVYATDGNGFEKCVGETQVDFSLKTIPVEISLNEETQKASIELDKDEVKTPGKIKEIRCAVWSEDKGQDDLKWYNLDYSMLNEKWTAEFPLTMFKSTGTCIAHLYVVKSDGTTAFLGGKRFKLDNPSLGSFDIKKDNAKGSFGITLNDLKLPLSYEKIEVAVWSQSNQSDLKWYEAKVAENGTFKVDSDISKHKYHIGTYNIHVYVTDGLGIRSCVGCTTMEFTKDIGKLTSTDDGKELQYKLNLPVNVYPAGLKEVRFGVWSTANGQDDLKWYTAVKEGKNYQATVDIKNHRTLGSYIVHAYGVDLAGRQFYLAGDGSMINVKGTAKGKLAVTGRNEQRGTFKVELADLTAPSGFYEVKIAAWTQKDQSDLYWYTCKMQSDGKWVAEVNVANHNYNAGAYNLHVYATMGNRITSYVAGTSYNMQPKNLMFVTSGKDKNKRTIGICNPTKTSDLKFAVWSEKNGQDDLVWYKAVKGANGKWTATVDGDNHYDGGTFNMHVYAGSSCLGVTSFNFPIVKMKNGWYYEKFNGKTYKVYYVNNKLQKDVSGIIGRQSKYRAEVNRKTCTVNIYALDGKNGFIIPVKVFACSVGMPDTPTPKGVFKTSVKYRWHMLMGPSYGQYCTRIVGGILFHSVAGYTDETIKNVSPIEYNKLGSPASHGCVRLNVRDAKWIYDNCPLNMEVEIYDSSYPGPFGKPATIKVPTDERWIVDPTDPGAKKA